MKKSQLQKYAKLIARKGVNVQKGQDVRVRACPDQLDFVRMVVEECYKAGAGKVIVVARKDFGLKKALECGATHVINNSDKNSPYYLFRQ